MDEQTVFNNALEKTDPRERAAYLDEACGQDQALRRCVESLLAVHHEAGDFLERPPVKAGDSNETALLDAFPRNSSELTEVSLEFLSPSAKPNCLDLLGHYEIMGIIGQGAMGTVLKAVDTELNRTVAVKVLAPQMAANPTARKRFLREAQAAAAVVHPHVVTIHAVGEEKNLPYLVMECVDGVSLRDKIDEEGPLPVREILRIGSQIADGLAAAHKQGLIHRDIKPANILLEDGVERVKITDFGLARAVDDLSVTRTGEVAGTPPFMSPEQAEGKRIDQRTDLFSLGSVLYTMCTGWAPFRADSTLAIIRQVCDGTARPIRELNPDIPEWLIEIIGRLQEKDPNERFQTAQEVSEILSRHLARLQHRTLSRENAAARVSQPVPEPPASSRRKNHLARGLAASVLLILAMSLGLTEATGVTDLHDTVIRLFSPDGTLVVEVDDPGVRVSIDGEDVIITGAGVQELRLRSGRHRLQAMKDGKVLKQELVTVASRGRRVVRVSREIEPLLATKAWEGSIAALKAEERTAAVLERLKALNPSFTGTLEGTVEGEFVTRLEVHGTGLRDLAPLQALEGLLWLDFMNSNAVQDLSPLTKLDLRYIGLASPTLTDLSPLKGSRLTDLHLTNCRRLSNLRPLEGVPLSQLSVCATAVDDLSPLKGMRLEFLNCGLCEKLTNLSPLAGMPLRRLILRGTPVADLGPLRGMPLVFLDYVSTLVTDISPLKDLPLEEVQCGFQRERDEAILRSIPTLKTIDDRPATEFWKHRDEK